MSVPLLLGNPYVEPVPTGFDYNLRLTQTPGSEQLPAGVTYSRAGALQTRRDHNGDLDLAPVNVPAWHYVGGALRGVIFRYGKRPLVNLLQHQNLNPVDLGGFHNTNSLRVINPDPAWPAFITKVHGIDGTSTSDNQDINPSNPVGAADPSSACGYVFNFIGGAQSRLKYSSSGEVVFDQTNQPGLHFLAGSMATRDGAHFRIQSLSRATLLQQWAGVCLYAGTLTLDELDVAWGADTLNVGVFTFQIPDGSYAPGTITLGYDDDLEAANTQTIDVVGGIYTLDPDDFGLAAIETVWRIYTTGAPAPSPEPATFDLRAGLPTGVLYDSPHQQIFYDIDQKVRLHPAGHTSPAYTWQSAPLGYLVEKSHQNKLGFPNVEGPGGGQSVVDDSAAAGAWSEVLPGGLVWDVAGDFLATNFGSTEIHSMNCLCRRSGALGAGNSILTQTPGEQPRALISKDDYQNIRLKNVPPAAGSDRPLLRNLGEGLRAALWTVIEDPYELAYPMYDPAGNGLGGGQRVRIQDTAYIPGEYDIVLTMGGGAVATLRGQTLSGEISFSADKADTPATFDFADFGLTRDQKFISQIQFNLPTVDPGPGPGPGPGPSGTVEVLVGLGIQEGSNFMDRVDSSAWNNVNKYGAGKVRHMGVSISWKTLEPQEGVYDFSKVDEYAAKARANGVRVAFKVHMYSFHRDSGKEDPRLVAPSWVTDRTPANFARWGGGDWPGFVKDTRTNGYKWRMWDPECQAAHKRLMVAFMAYCSTVPEVCAVETHESSIGRIITDNGGVKPEDDRAAKRSIFFHYVDVVQACCGVRVDGGINYYFNWNWSSGMSDSELDDIYDDIFVPLQVGLIINDPTLHSDGIFTGNNHSIAANKWISRKQTPVYTKGEQYSLTGGKEWHKLTSKSGSRDSHERWMEYIVGGPSAHPNNMGCAGLRLPDWLPSGPSRQAAFYDWFSSASQDAAFFDDFWQRDYFYVPIGG